MTDRPTRWPETPDIVTRLRARREDWTCIREEAASEIEKLRAKLNAITTTLTAEIERIKDASCTGCHNAPTEAEPNYPFHCYNCRRFYGDLFVKEESK